MNLASMRQQITWFLPFPLILILTIAGFACRAEQPAGDPPEELQADTSSSPPSPPETPIPGYLLPDTVDDGRTVAQRLEDASISAKIKLALVEHDSLRIYDFVPVVNRGHVVLQGQVQTLRERDVAARVVRLIKGVRDVNNQIITTGSSDTLLAAETDQTSPIAPSEPREVSPGEPSGATASREEPSPAYHTVRSGESLWTVATAYGLTVEQLKRLNKKGTNIVKPGERLRVR